MANKVIIVIASRRDAMARTFVERYAAYGTCLMTPDDLSLVGWHHRLGESKTSTAVVAGCQLASRDICGVVTRLPYVVEQDVGHILPADRAYVAAEMNAFLKYWLRELPCPLLNRPALNCLSGPYWRHEKWVNTAARLGMPVIPARRYVVCSNARATEAPLQPDGVTVTIVGQRHFGAVDQALARQARSLADAAGVDLLAVRFSGPELGALFVGVNLWPDMALDEVADTILEYLQGDHARGV